MKIVQIAIIPAVDRTQPNEVIALTDTGRVFRMQLMAADLRWQELPAPRG